MIFHYSTIEVHFVFLLTEFNCTFYYQHKHNITILCLLLFRGRVDDLSFLEYLSPFCF